MGDDRKNNPTFDRRDILAVMDVWGYNFENMGQQKSKGSFFEVQ